VRLAQQHNSLLERPGPGGKPHFLTFIILHVTARKGTKILKDHGGRILVQLKELCYVKAETLEDAEEAARGWQYNLVRYRSGLRCCDVGRYVVVVTTRDDGVV